MSHEIVIIVRFTLFIGSGESLDALLDIQWDLNKLDCAIVIARLNISSTHL